MSEQRHASLAEIEQANPLFFSERTQKFHKTGKWKRTGSIISAKERGGDRVYYVADPENELSLININKGDGSFYRDTPDGVVSVAIDEKTGIIGDVLVEGE